MGVLFRLLLTSLAVAFCVNADSVVYKSPYQYIFVTTQRTWSDARRDCETRKAHLVKIDSDDVTRIITNYLQKHPQTLWIGTSDINKEGEWKWPDGTWAIAPNAAYNKWPRNPVQPDNANGIEDCGSIVGDGTWNDLPCTNKLCYICQKGPVFSNEYRFVFRDDKKTWEKAKQECSKDNSSLVKIDSDSITDVIKSNLLYDKRWMGASDLTTEGTWVWLDDTSAGTNAQYQKWSSSEPSNGGNAEDCGVVTNYEQRWNDISCSSNIGYVCQKRLQTIFSLNNRILTFYRSDRLEWSSAKAACITKGSRLLEIQDEASDNFIRRNIFIPDAKFWIGGTEISGNSVEWESGDTASYVKWAPGQPDSVWHKKVAVATNGWYDLWYGDNHPYICEMEYLTNIDLRTPDLAVINETVDPVSCSANGLPSSNVYWKSPYREVRTTTDFRIYQAKGASHSLLHVQRASVEDEGTYTCFAENKAGKLVKILQANLTLTVPSHPVYVTLEPVNCTSNVSVEWKPSPYAAQTKHKITINSKSDSNNIHEFLTIPESDEAQVFQLMLSPWTNYTIKVKIMPCPGDDCMEHYVTSNTTSLTTQRSPGAVDTLTVELSGSHDCAVTWRKSIRVPAEEVSHYIVNVVNGSINGSGLSLHNGGIEITIPELSHAATQETWTVGVIVGSVVLILAGAAMVVFLKKKRRVAMSPEENDTTKADISAATYINVQSHKRQQNYEQVEEKPERKVNVDSIRKTNEEAQYISPNNHFDEATAGYEVVTGMPDLSVSQPQSNSAYSSRHEFRLDEKPHGYDTVKIVQEQDEKNCVYSKIEESTYEPIRVTESETS